MNKTKKKSNKSMNSHYFKVQDSHLDILLSIIYENVAVAKGHAAILQDRIYGRQTKQNKISILSKRLLNQIWKADSTLSSIQEQWSLLKKEIEK